VLAYRLTREGCSLDDVTVPSPGPGEVLVKVDAAGLCHSDLTLASRPADQHPFPLPLVLGHELAGTVVGHGPSVAGSPPASEAGTHVVGYGPRGCGSCPSCAIGAENCCPQPPADARPLGLGTPGALAEYVAIDARYVVPSDVDPVQGAALTDAGLTALGALNRAARLGPPGRRGPVVVIGVGGLGHLAVQLARELGHDEVVAVDVDDRKLALALDLGATAAVPSSEDLVADVRDAVGGAGAAVVLDLVASDTTLRAAGDLVSIGGVVSVVGVGAGRLPVGMHALPLGVTVDLPYWGARGELEQLLELARRGTIRVVTEEVALADVPTAYGRLARGDVVGRVVARP
jgi:propanol-preferring alcohol dehydrogenase